MKNFKNWLLASAAILSLSACENEFSVNDDWEDVTVVYGLLNADADTNWLRIERGYLGSAPAEASFDEPDSLYYDSLVVQLEELNDNNVSQKVITLERDDSPRLKPGIFTTDDYRLYYTTQKLNDEMTYRLTVDKPGLKNGKVASAVTQLVETSKVINGIPQGFKMVNPPQAQPTPVFQGSITLDASENAYLYEVDIYFKYKEVDRTSGAESLHELKLDYESINASPDDQRIRSNKIRMSDLYQAVANELQPTDDVIRFFRTLRIEVWAGGEQLSKYIELNKPGSGLAQSRPEFPQIENGTGLLSSRTKLTVDNVIFNSNDERLYYLSEQLCDRGFGLVQGTDTFYCEFNDEGDPERVRY